MSKVKEAVIKKEVAGLEEETIQLAEKYARLKEKVDKEKRLLDEYKQKLVSLMDTLGLKTVEANGYKVNKVEKIRTKLDVEGIAKKLTKSELVEVCTISRTKLRKMMSENDISKYEFEPTITAELRITKVGK